MQWCFLDGTDEVRKAAKKFINVTINCLVLASVLTFSPYWIR